MSLQNVGSHHCIEEQGASSNQQREWWRNVLDKVEEKAGRVLGSSGAEQELYEWTSVLRNSPLTIVAATRNEIAVRLRDIANGMDSDFHSRCASNHLLELAAKIDHGTELLNKS